MASGIRMPEGQWLGVGFHFLIFFLGERKHFINDYDSIKKFHNWMKDMTQLEWLNHYTFKSMRYNNLIHSWLPMRLSAKKIESLLNKGLLNLIAHIYICVGRTPWRAYQLAINWCIADARGLTQNLISKPTAYLPLPFSIKRRQCLVIVLLEFGFVPRIRCGVVISYGPCLSCPNASCPLSMAQPFQTNCKTKQTIYKMLKWHNRKHENMRRRRESWPAPAAAAIRVPALGHYVRHII